MNFLTSTRILVSGLEIRLLEGPRGPQFDKLSRDEAMLEKQVCKSQ